MSANRAFEIDSDGSISFVRTVEGKPRAFVLRDGHYLMADGKDLLRSSTGVGVVASYNTAEAAVYPCVTDLAAQTEVEIASPGRPHMVEYSGKLIEFSCEDRKVVFAVVHAGKYLIHCRSDM